MLCITSLAELIDRSALICEGKNSKQIYSKFFIIIALNISISITVIIIVVIITISTITIAVIDITAIINIASTCVTI
jgi:hypothetical protein